jgi:sporulation protein YlmC with PRC-barrel domain
MTIELSKMFGMDIYSTNAEYIGKAYDFVIDLEQGKVFKITLEPFKVRSKKEAADILKKKSVSYEKVVAVKDIILIDPNKTAKPAAQVAPRVGSTLSRLSSRRRLYSR